MRAAGTELLTVTCLSPINLQPQLYLSTSHIFWKKKVKLTINFDTFLSSDFERKHHKSHHKPTHDHWRLHTTSTGQPAPGCSWIAQLHLMQLMFRWDLPVSSGRRKGVVLSNTQGQPLRPCTCSSVCKVAGKHHLISGMLPLMGAPLIHQWKLALIQQSSESWEGPCWSCAAALLWSGKVHRQGTSSGNHRRKPERLQTSLNVWSVRHCQFKWGSSTPQTDPTVPKW